MTPSVALMFATADKRPSNCDRAKGGSDIVGRERLATALSAADRLAIAPGAARSMPKAAAALNMALAFALTAALADSAADSAAAAPGAPNPIPSDSCTFAISEPIADSARKGAILMLSSALRLGKFKLIDAMMDPKSAEALALSNADPIAWAPSAADATADRLAAADAETESPSDAMADNCADADALSPPPSPPSTIERFSAAEGRLKEISGRSKRILS